MAGDFPQAGIRAGDFRSIFGGAYDEALVGARTRRRPDLEVRDPAAGIGYIGQPVHVVVGVRSQGVTFLGPGFPPGGPIAAQAAIALLGGFVGSKEARRDAVLAQDPGHQFCNSHVAGVESQIQHFVAIVCGSFTGTRQLQPGRTGCEHRGRCRECASLHVFKAMSGGCASIARRCFPRGGMRILSAARGPGSRRRGAICPH